MEEKEVIIWGNIDKFKLIFSIDNHTDNYKREIYGMEVEGLGVAVLMTGNVNQNAYATGTFIPGTMINDITDTEGLVVAREIVKVV